MPSNQLTAPIIMVFSASAPCGSLAVGRHSVLKCPPPPPCGATSSSTKWWVGPSRPVLQGADPGSNLWPGMGVRCRKGRRLSWTQPNRGPWETNTISMSLTFTNSRKGTFEIGPFTCTFCTKIIFHECL